MKFNYSFNLPQAASAPVAPKKVIAYDTSEFSLDLADHWQEAQVGQQNTLNWISEQESASITLSVDFYDIPADKAHAVAENVLSARHSALTASTSTPISVLRREVKPHSGGIGLELVYFAEVQNECAYQFIGYVTSRKIFNFTVVSTRGPQHATTLFQSVMGSLRVNLP
jgi:hypothetical protein